MFFAVSFSYGNQNQYSQFYRLLDFSPFVSAHAEFTKAKLDRYSEQAKKPPIHRSDGSVTAY